MFRPVSASLLIALLMAVDLPGQTTYASLRGTINDPSGATISSASVTVKNNATGEARQMLADSAGNFLFPQLPVGRYELVVEATGFQRHTVRDIILQVDARRQEDVVLKVGDVNQQVTVEALAATVNTTNATIGEVIDRRPIVELPLNGRNFLQLAQLTPGTVPPVLQNGEDTTSSFNGRRTNLTVAVSGTRHVSAAYLFDGVLGREEFYGAVSVQPTLEGIAEFKIMRGYFSPEYQAPAVVSVVSRSGANEFNGAVWEFVRNNTFDARNTFDLTGKIPPFRQNQFGGSFGGRIIRNKLFFIANAEALRTRQSFSQNLLLPTADMLGGNLSGFNPIYDPATANAQNVKTLFPNNTVPANRISAFSRKYNDFLLTSATSPLSPAARAAGSNFIGLQKVVVDGFKYDTRWDWVISSSDRIFGRVNRDITDQTDQEPKRGGSRVYPLHSANAVISWSKVVSPNVINDARIGFSRAFLHAGGPVQGENSNWPGFFGLQNISLTDRCSGVPIVALLEYGSWGFPSGSCIHTTNQSFTFFDNASIVRGKHTISFGGQLERVNLRHEVAFTPQGSFTFTGQFSEGFDGAARIPNTGNVVADYLLGFPVSATAQARVSPTYRRGWWWGVYLNDDIRVSQNLTLNLGLRYQIQQPLTEKFDNIADFDFVTGTQRFAGKNGAPRGLYPTDRNDFAPRLGIAWRPGGKDDLAVRASYGIFYDRLPGNDQAWQAIIPPFNVGQNFVTPNQVVPSINIGSLFPQPNLQGGLPNGAFLFNLQGRRTTYLQQWTLSVQKNLPFNLFWEVAYVGSKGAKLSKRYDRNVGTIPVAGDTRPVSARRPYPNLGFILSDEGAGISKYHAVQSSLRKTYSNGLTFMFNYLFGRSMDTDSYDGKATRFYRPGDNDYGRSIFDIRQRAVLSFNWELPFFRGTKGVAKYILDGWSMNSITSFQTGLPFHVAANDRSGAGVNFGGRPNRICNGNLPPGERTRFRWFDTSCFVDPALNTFGNAGVHYLDTDGLKGQDFGLFKNFNFTERHRLQFRWEAFNAFNYTNLNRPGNSVSAPATFARVLAAQPARTMQIGAKLYF
ncbi:MAG: TonB-dependent receptor [Bryobacterales bacterium]|nr:TonB-dependent receptor [Bryobacterales bacterium]